MFANRASCLCLSKAAFKRLMNLTKKCSESLIFSQTLQSSTRLVLFTRPRLRKKLAAQAIHCFADRDITMRNDFGHQNALRVSDFSS